MSAAPGHRRGRQARGGPRIAVDLAEIGEADYTLEDLHDEWNEPTSTSPRTPSSSRTTRDARSATRTSAAATCWRVVDPRREGEGAGTALLEWARAARPRARRDSTCARASATAAPARRRCSSARLRGRPQLLPARARRQRGRRRAAPACAPLDAEDAPALYAIHEAAFAADPDYTPQSPRKRGRSASSAPTRSTTTSAAWRRGARASRSPAAGRTTSPTSPLLAVAPRRTGPGPRHAAAASRLRRRRARRAAPGRPQRRLRQPERGPPLRARRHDAALAGRRLPESAARLGAQWAPSRSTLPTTSAARRWCSSRRLAPEGGAEVFGKLEMFNPGGSVKDRIGVAMIEAAEQEGRIEPGRTHDRRGHQRQHRHRARVRVRGQGLRADPHAAAGHEPRARGPAAPLRRAGAHHGVDGRHERGGRRRARDGARRGRLPARPVLEPGQPRHPPPHHRPGAVGGAGRQDRLPRRRRRHRRDDHRRRLVPEGAQPGRSRCRRRAGDARRCSPAAAPARTRSRASARASSRPCCDRDLLDEIIAVDDEDAIETARAGRPPRRRAVRHLLRRGAVGGAADRGAPRGQGQADRGRAARQRRALRLDAVLRARADPGRT